MSYRDLKNNIATVSTLVPSVASASADGASVDARGYETVTALVHTGAIVGAGNFTLKLQDSANGTDWSDVPSAGLLGAFEAVSTANSVTVVGYIGGKRYVRAVATKNSGTSLALGAVLVLGTPTQSPV